VGLEKKQGVLTENLWPKLFSEAPRCAPLRLSSIKASHMPSVNRSESKAVGFCLGRNCAETGKNYFG
jgi:hypothetical protein